MEHKITIAIGHIAKSHYELSKILEAERDAVLHLSHLITSIPDEAFGGVHICTVNSLSVSKNIAAFLNSLADLEMAVADNLEAVMKEMKDEQEE